MPLYDCMFLFKPHLPKEALLDLGARVGKHIYARNGVLTQSKYFGEIQLGYGIKKLDERYFQGKLMQMTMMTTPNINKELHYLNKEDRLLRWLLVKHRDVKLGTEYMINEEIRGDLSTFHLTSMHDDDDDDDMNEYVGTPDDDEYEVENKERVE